MTSSAPLLFLHGETSGSKHTLGGPCRWLLTPPLGQWAGWDEGFSSRNLGAPQRLSTRHQAPTLGALLQNGCMLGEGVSHSGKYN